MEPISTHEIVSAVIESTNAVFSTMLGLQIRAGAHREEPAGTSGFNGVVALVGVAGSWTGSGRISCSSLFACRLASALLSAPGEAVNPCAVNPCAVNEDVLDAVAEVANMIIGNVKAHFEERLGPLSLSIPTVVFGRNYQARFSGVQEWTVIPFQCEDEPMEVRFCLVPSPHVAQLARRPAVLA